MDEFPKPGLAYGVDPIRRRFYSLRQARYDALAQDVSDWAGEAAARGQMLRVLDIGCGTGVALRHLERKPHFDHVRLEGADLTIRSHLYKPELYRALHVGDLMAGYPELPSASFDVVICEQLLEHLPRVESAIATLERLLKPGGHLIVGVPIFPAPFAAIRRHLVPLLDRAFQPRRSRGHLQIFTLRSFLRAMRENSTLALEDVRGFRIVSGGVIEPLEDYRWWWRLNRRIGALVPSLCIEVQAIMAKPVSARS